MVCKICDKTVKDMKGLASHIESHKISVQDYYDKYIQGSKTCIVCGKPTNFINMSQGYYRRCSACRTKMPFNNVKGEFHA